MLNEELNNENGETTDVELQGYAEKEILPGLKFQGQTPIISTIIGKRLCSDLSPLTESVDDVLMNKTQALVERSLSKYLPKIFAEHFNWFTAEQKWNQWRQLWKI